MVDIGYLGDLSIYKLRTDGGRAAVKAAIANIGPRSERDDRLERQGLGKLSAGSRNRADAMRKRP